MTRGLTKYQQTVLTYIALNGSQNILNIQENTGLNYATTHRSIKTLEKYNLIWLTEKDPRGPKGAQYYGLTPYGIVELYLRGKKNNPDKITQNWDKITPRMIARHTVHPYQTNKSLPWRDNLLIIHRNILDGILLDSLEPTQIESIKEVIKGDPEYRELWKHWFSVKTFLYKYLEKTNQNIMTQ